MSKTVVKFDEIKNHNEFIKIIDEFFARNCEKTIGASMRYSSEIKFPEYIDDRCDAYNGDTYIYSNGVCLGLDSNSIGPHGKSDFWEYDEETDRCYSTTPDIDASIFIDHVWNVIVMYDSFEDDDEN